jgi:hypothetical protein
MFHWWGEMQRTSVFLYLMSRKEFTLLPIEASADDFLDVLEGQAADVDPMRNLFGAYAYICDTLQRERRDYDDLTIPESIRRTPVHTDPFSIAECKIIDAYEENYLAMRE